VSINNARERILQTAVRIFAEKSFEGSRIEEIAREANVPKSLIYYHFRSKDEILEVLTKNFMDEYMTIIESSVNETHQEKAQELSGRMKNIYYEFGRKNEDLLRVMLIDSLKKTKETPILFKVIEAMIKKESENNANPTYDINERRIAEFFTSFIPNYAYICFAESWTKYFDIERSKFDNLYLKVYGETHGAYHKNHK
jgi:AcrR family transcriptional regulator